MKKTISIICAVQPKPNPGMSSVDLAFYAFAMRHFPEAELHFWKILDERILHQARSACERAEIEQRHGMPFKYKSLQGNLEQLYRSDVVLYWGDFFHMAHYRESEARRQMKIGAVETYEQGLEIVDKYFFLNEAPEDVFKKVIVFGENLLFNTVHNYTGGTYADNFKYFINKVNHIWMRDVFSALTVSHIKNDYDRSCLGMDCSVLLKDEDLDVLQRNFVSEIERSKNKVGVFFHRNTKNLSKQFKFAKQLAHATCSEAQWLPWRIDKRIKSKIRWCFPTLEIIQSEKGPSEGDLFHLIKNYKFVISDTYHVCVNAWRLGTPAICIGEYTTDNDWDVSCGPAHAWRDKRWVFFSMIEGLKYYVHAHELTNTKKFKKRIEQLVDALAAEKDLKTITSYIHRQRNNLEMQLQKTISKMFQN